MKEIQLITMIIIVLSYQSCKISAKVREFPASFKFGAASAAYQVEGAWNIDGKGENIWDNLFHNHPELVDDRSNADISSDSYHHFDDDLKALKELGANFYRFSISWSRILPNGDLSNVNRAGIKYYNSMINKLINAGIEPIVTMYHWDLPQALEANGGGFLHPIFQTHFKNYANVLFHYFSDRVKYWLTFNEPLFQCRYGYGTGLFAPAVVSEGIGEYKCVENTIKAHALVYHLYREKYFNKHPAKISISLNGRFYFSEFEDNEIIDRALQFSFGIFAHPIFSEKGGYPDVVVSRINEKSKIENRNHSRLEHLSEHWKNTIRGTADFFGLNYYTSRMIRRNESKGVTISWLNDAGYSDYPNPKWERGFPSHLYIVPEGLEGLLKWLRDEYNNVEVIVIENGYGDEGELNDNKRISYYEKHLNAIMNAIDDGCNVTGYSAWSLIDNFEWHRGYTQKFGLYHVDFNSPNRTRSPKKSAKFFRDIISTKIIQASGSNHGSYYISFKLILLFNIILVFNR